MSNPAPFILINFWPFLNMTIVLFQTFCTVSIRFQKSFIQRFSASSSLFIFPPWNCVSAILHPPSSINHHPSSIIHHPLSISSSLFIFPPWNCVSFFFLNCVSSIILNLHLPPRHVCDRMNCERERKRKGICSILFSWISSQRKLIRLIDSPAHNIPLFLQRPLFYPTYGHWSHFSFRVLMTESHL